MGGFCPGGTAGATMGDFIIDDSLGGFLGIGMEVLAGGGGGGGPSPTRRSLSLARIFRTFAHLSSSLSRTLLR